MNHISAKQPVPARRAVPRSHAVANIVPNVARSLLGLIQDRGRSAERLCRGLGFTYRDLQDRELLLSHQQVRTLILRAQAQLGESAIGLAVGARQTPVSWGLAGLAMLTCETFGEAIAYGIGHQGEAGAMMDHLFEDSGREAYVEVMPRIFDLHIEPFLIEEAFASALAVSRCLVGKDLKPVHLDLGFDDTGNRAVYARFFRCPVRFNAGANRMTLESYWLRARLPGYDRITCGLIREQLNSLLQRPVGRNDLVESVSSRIRFGIEDRPRQADMARSVNVSERTLRRRLGAQSAGYRELRDTALHDRARDLLANSLMTIAEIARAIGYSDARAFRRAFKRWSGQLPTEFRARD